MKHDRFEFNLSMPTILLLALVISRVLSTITWDSTLGGLTDRIGFIVGQIIKSRAYCISDYFYAIGEIRIRIQSICSVDNHTKIQT